MAKRGRKRTVYFNGSTELDRVGNILVGEVTASQEGRWPTEDERRLTGPRQLAGRLPLKRGDATTWDHLVWLPVTRAINVIATDAPHACDWRCMGAKPHGDCECECRGRNHGLNYKARDFA